MPGDLWPDDPAIGRSINRIAGTSWVSEVPVGAIDSTNKEFVASRKFWPTSLFVIVDGLIVSDYVVSAQTHITVTIPPSTSILIKYVATDVTK